MNNNKLRVFNDDTNQYYLYCQMYKSQTVEFVKSKINQYSKFKNGKMSICKAISLLDKFIDPSDPDIDVPNSIHAYQTAERIRKDHPNNKEFQIIGLIHDLGKVLYSFNEPSWMIVGDTYALGCQFPKSIVYYDELVKLSPQLNKQNKINKDSIIGMNSQYGIYKPNCGLDNLVISFGHDEYLYMVLVHNKKLGKHNISDKYLDMIRYHSFYPWHTYNEYTHLMNNKDHITKQNVLELNKYDLYSKEDDINVSQEIINYYDKLLNEYFDGELEW